MILIGRNQSPFVRRVSTSLNQLGLRFEQRALSAAADADAVRAKNPLTRVPALEIDGGEVLIDSGAILDYLDEVVGPERALTPVAGPDRRAVKRIEALAVGALEKAVSAYYEVSRRPAEKVHQPWIDQCRAQALGGMSAIAALAGDGWLVGGRVTQADITVACAASFMQTALKIDPAEAYPGLAGLLARVKALPAFIATQPS